MAKWSSIWDEVQNKFSRDLRLTAARFEVPLVKVKKGGQYPHKQEFRRPATRKQEQTRVSA